MPDFICLYCSRAFKKQQTLDTHKCVKRDRFLDQKSPFFRIGIQAFREFYKKDKTVDEFINSAYYNPFTKFGKYCVDVNVISPEKYASWLIKSGKRIDDWIRDSVYTEYLIEYLPSEDVGPALTRAIKWSQIWGDSSCAPPHDCLRYGNLNSIAFAIVTGRLSGWALYNSDSGQGLLDSLMKSEPLLQQCWPYINADIWSLTFNSRRIDQVYAKNILKQAGW